MKDFDAETRDARREMDRRFKIGGETFTRKAGVRPEVMFEYEDMKVNMTSADAVAVIDRTIVAFLADDDGAERYKRLREDDGDHPLTVKDLAEVVEWLVSEATGRPTSRPLRSTDGPGAQRDGTRSTDDSLSPVAEATG